MTISVGYRIMTMASALALTAATAQAAEQATSVYLLGSKTSMSGFIPPPGTYLVDLNFYYSGSATGSAAVGVGLRRNGARDLGGTPINVLADIRVDADAYYQIPTAIWVLPGQVLGGNLGFSLSTPVGWKSVGVDLDARVNFTVPAPINRTFTAGQRFSADDSQTHFGDPLASAFIGWHSGSWHWNVGTMVNIPLGQWETGRLANIGFNHWAVDTTAAVTWLDPKIGFELSVATGVTLNFENPDTNYKSGTDFHVEFAAVQHFSPKFSMGLAGYHYQQLTGDSGAGALLGDFKGRVSALGPVVNYTFQLGPLPIATKLNWFHEFNELNRLKGDVGLLSITIPLGGPPPAGPPSPLK